MLALTAILSSCQTTPRKTPLDKVLTPPPSGQQVPAQQQAQPEPSELQPGETAKIGLILGPGGLKTLAHIGVLREFEKAGIRVHAVAGLEWGALVAAAYSMKGKANDAEWQVFKLKKNDLPDKGILSSELSPDNIKSLAPFLNGVFANKTIESSDLPFACPSVLLENGRIAWWDKGTYTQALSKCLPFPPMYEANGNWLAAAFRVEEAAQKLREKGANVIVFVNVLARGQILKGRKVKSDNAIQALWWEGVHQLENSKRAVDWIVGVHTRNYDILDFDARQSLVLFGQEFGAVAAKKIADTHGF